MTHSGGISTVTRQRTAKVGQPPPSKRYERFKEENARWDRRVKEAVQKIGKDSPDKTPDRPSER